jgi:Uma2 family endonuclease
LGSYPTGADLVVEVVSDGQESRERDLERKPYEYAQNGVSEYWIVDPLQYEITVLVPAQTEKSYRTHGVFRRGERASSVLLKGFSVAVDEVFSQSPS